MLFSSAPVCHNKRAAALDKIAKDGATGKRPQALQLLAALVMAFGGVIVIVLAVVLALLVQMGRSQDQAAAEASRAQLRGLMALQARQLASHVRDYTHWDEAIDRLAVAYDPVWWEGNAGDYAIKGFALSFSLAVDGRDRLRLQAVAEGAGTASAEGTLTPSLRALLAQARSRPLAASPDEAVATGLVAFGGRLHLAAASRYLPESSDTVNPDPQALLVFASSLDEGVLPASAAIMGDEGLRWQEHTPEAGSFEPVRLADGVLDGGVAWMPPAPGRQVVVRLVPLVTAAFAVMGVLLLLFLRRARRLADSIHAEARARESLDQRNQSILEAAGEGIFGVDASGKVVFVNPAALQALGFETAEFIGREPHELIRCRLPGSNVSGAMACPVRKTLVDGSSSASDVENFTRKDGTLFPVEYQVTPILQDGKVAGAVAAFHDITRRRCIEEEIRYRANYDTLTGLPNRDLLVERLTQEIKLARRDGVTVGLLYLDLDRFKNVNDAAGHEVGDLLLQQVAQRLRACVRESDTVGRLGGDEFALMLPHVHQAADAARIAEKAIAALGEPFELNGQEAWIGASIGITVFPGDGGSASELLRHADLAMYKAKESGRNTYQFYEAEMMDSVQQRRALESDLRHALDNGELLVHYQPIVELATGRTVHVEALMRWCHPVRGMVSPATFIPVAEEAGLIVEMGAWMLHECCRQIAAWRVAGLHLAVAVNVSGRQVPQGLPLDLIEATLASHGVPSSAIVFEITESVLLNTSALVKDWLDGVRRLGIELMIDDFGTGYSSLSYLKHFILKSLKVDQSFVSGVVDDPEDQALVGAILAMARSLGLSVVAEGVETPAQRDWLQRHGCQYAQGYLFSRPVDAQTLLVHLTETQAVALE